MNAVEVVEAMHGHLARREGAELLELLHPDVRWVVPDVLPFGGTVTGRDDAAAMLAAISEHVYDWTPEVDDVLAFGSRAIAIGRHVVATETGVFVEVAFLQVFEVHDGLVTHFEDHMDTLLLLRAIGRSATGAPAPPA